ncbi:MAG: site-specific DNA-methyltransferase, partial [bacterium]|nr:site-specific DNA-methyltransferase [bacterium]
VLAEIGYADALLCRELPDGSLEILDGHLRAETTPDSVVPVLITDLDDAEARALLLTHDPLGAMAEANHEALIKLMSQIETQSDGVQDMLDALAAEHGVEPETADAEEAEPPEAELDRAAELQAQWKTEPGQLWEIPGKAGVHRLLCGDSTKADDVQRVLGGEEAGLCFTSPPYGQQRDYGQLIDDWDGLMEGVFGNLPMKDDGQVLVNLGLIYRDGQCVTYWADWVLWMQSQGWRRFGWYVWDQGSGLPADWLGRFAPSHEWVFHFNQKAVRPHKTIEKQPTDHGPQFGPNTRGSGLRSRDGRNAPPFSLCLDPNKIPDSVVRVNREYDNRSGHPAVFPVGLPAHFLRCWDGLTYDPFLGSGTTMVAAEQLGRVCCGIEIDPKYVAVALQRMKDMGLAPKTIQGTP